MQAIVQKKIKLALKLKLLKTALNFHIMEVFLQEKHNKNLIIR